MENFIKFFFYSTLLGCFLMSGNTKKVEFRANWCPPVAPAHAEPALPGEFPYMFVLGWVKDDEAEEDQKYEYRCGGAMLSQDYVLTAAHCMYYSDELPSVVRSAGSDNPSDYYVIIDIELIIEHPDYEYPYSYNDIALVKLDQNDRHQFAYLPTWQPVLNETVTIVGYGSQKFAGPPSEKLLKADVQIITNEECSKFYEPDETVSLQRDGIVHTQVCAQDLIDKLRDACQGDSGGPIVRRHLGIHYIVGITSFGIGCGDGPPGVYTRVSEYIPWIESVMRPWYNEEFAHMFYFRWMNSVTCEYEQKKCGATLISWNYVLLAAHCMFERNEFPFLFMSEGFNIRYRDSLSIRSAYVPDEYVYPLPYHDIGLININFLPLYVTPIWLQRELKNHTLIGYNYNGASEEAIKNQDLPKTELTYVPKNVCQRYYEHVPKDFPKGITDGLICVEDKAQDWESGLGYSEGPLVMWLKEDNVDIPYLVGIGVFGVNCKYCPPAVYTSIYSELDWISSFVWPNVSAMTENSTENYGIYGFFNNDVNLSDP